MLKLIGKSLKLSRAPRRCAGSFAELMARNADNRKAPFFFWKRFKVRLDKDLNGITAGVNVDANGRIAEIDFVTSSVLSSNESHGACPNCSAKSRRFSQPSRRPDDASDNVNLVGTAFIGQAGDAAI
jgi:hypothetical protein